MPSLKNVENPLTKSVLISLGLTAATSAADAGIHTNIFGSGVPTRIINFSNNNNFKWRRIHSNEEMDAIMKVIEYLQEFALFVKKVYRIIQNEEKEQKDGFLAMLFVALGATLLRKSLTGKRVKAKIPDQGLIRAGGGIIRAV